MKVTIGRIVHFRLSTDHADEINRRTTRGPHAGNVAAGEVFPGIVTRVSSGGAVDGQVFLNGNDQLGVTSVTEGDQAGQWCWPTF